MRYIVKFIGLLVLLILIAVPSGCTRPVAEDEAQPPTPAPEEVPVVLEQGSTSREPEYYIDDQGRIIYTDPADMPDDGSTLLPGVNIPPVFPGAQRVHPADEEPSQRQSFITRAPYDALVAYYTLYLSKGITNPQETTSEPESIVNSIVSQDENHLRQTALFVNDDDGPRGGMKVMLKEFSLQDMVQIVLTTLTATPSGLNPVGMYITPEQAEEIADQYTHRQEELERQRQEAEGSAVDPSEDDSGEGD